MLDAAYARAELEYTRARERIGRLKLLKAERKLQRLGESNDDDDDNETVDGDADAGDPLAGPQNLTNVDHVEGEHMASSDVTSGVVAHLTRGCLSELRMTDYGAVPAAQARALARQKIENDAF